MSLEALDSSLEVPSMMNVEAEVAEAEAAASEVEAVRVTLTV
jgi:hypothetical protein